MSLMNPVRNKKSNIFADSAKPSLISNGVKRASKIIFAASIFFALSSSAHAALININTADQATLDTLSGIGPTYAARIIEYRLQHGPFKAIREIQNIKGIGPKTFAGIKDFITVETVPQPAAPAPATKPQTTSTKPAKTSVTSKQPAQPVAAEAPQTQLVAAANEAVPSEFPLGAALVGLVGLVGLGALGAWYARPKVAAGAGEETPPSVDEFDIE